ncbi:hypothetical protein, partial [Seonamhaeicola maritimus]|uniref:hypothetical protein n=1 Tax=Seonamhaeicola maritimus TaxID=2591822 RepID=UPI002493FF7E
TNSDPAGACNPGDIVPPTFSVEEGCSPNGDVVVTSPAGAETQDNCNYSQTWYANYTDGCDNPAVQKSV